MSEQSQYTPPKVWTWNKPSGGRFASINRPIAGPTHDKELPVGRHPLQLYLSGFPNIARWFRAIDSRPAVARARAVGRDHAFKKEVDDEARRALFPSNYPKRTI